jgi:hypothetical protein
MTDERIHQRFHDLLALLPEPYRSAIQKGRERGMRIITDESEIDKNPLGPIRIAGSIGGLFYFRPSRITEPDLDKVLIHEQMHFYLEQRDGLRYRDFYVHACMSCFEIFKVKRLRQRNEDEAIALTKKVLQEMQLAGSPDS